MEPYLLYYIYSSLIGMQGMAGINHIWLQISDHTATTSCTLFDVYAENLLDSYISNLLNSLDGKFEEPLTKYDNLEVSFFRSSIIIIPSLLHKTLQ